MIYVIDTNIILNNPSLSQYKGEIVYIPVAVMRELDNQKSKEGTVGFKSRLFHRKLKEVKSLEGDSYDFDGVTVLNPNVILESHTSEVKIADDWFVSSEILKSEGYVAHTSDFSCYNLMRLNNRNCEYIPQQTKEDYSKLNNSYTEVYVKPEVVENINLFKDFDNYGCMDYLLLINISDPKNRRLVKIRNNKLHHVENKTPYGVKAKNIEQKILIDALLDDDVKIVILSAKQGCGKAEPNITPIPTPSGWTTMGELRIGDVVFDRTGKPTNITGVFPQGQKPVYKITFLDGRVNYCADEHLWDIYTESTKRDKTNGKNPKQLTINTLELKRLIETAKDGKKHRPRGYFVQNNDCVEYKERKVEVDPYVMGVMLGDGCMTCSGLIISSNEEDVVRKVATKLKADITEPKNNYSWRVKMGGSDGAIRAKEYFKKVGLDCIAKNKFIPKEYLQNSYENRIELLKGLMDTDGCVNEKNKFNFSTCSKHLCDNFMELCRSLGYTVSLYVSDRESKGVCYNVTIQTNNIIFSSKKHIDRYNRNMQKYKNIKTKSHMFNKVVAVEYDRLDECTCIQVDNDEHLYLTENYTVTHNTHLGLACGLEQVAHKGKYSRILLAKSQAPLSRHEEIGWLTGDIENKLRYSMVNYTSNLEALSSGVHTFEKDNIKIRRDGMKIFEEFKTLGQMDFLPLDSILGASYDNTYVCVDEAQSLDLKAIRSCLTRITDSSKMILMGDVAQQTDVMHSIDKSGLYLANKYLRNVKGVCVLTLSEIERGNICRDVADALDKIEVLG